MNKAIKARIARLLFLQKKRDELLKRIPYKLAFIAVRLHHQCMLWNQEILAGCTYFLERMHA